MEALEDETEDRRRQRTRVVYSMESFEERIPSRASNQGNRDEKDREAPKNGQGSRGPKTKRLEK